MEEFLSLESHKVKNTKVLFLTALGQGIFINPKHVIQSGLINLTSVC